MKITAGYFLLGTSIVLGISEIIFLKHLEGTRFVLYNVGLVILFFIGSMEIKNYTVRRRYIKNDI